MFLVEGWFGLWDLKATSYETELSSLHQQTYEEVGALISTALIFTAPFLAAPFFSQIQLSDYMVENMFLINLVFTGFGGVCMGWS